MPPPNASPDDSAFTGVLDRNIHAIIQARKEEDKNLVWKDKAAMEMTRVFGSMRFIFIHIVVFGAWGFCNSGLVPALKFDPGFSILDVLISMEAIFLSTVVLINQNRTVKVDSRRADLNLQVSLLAEHEVTHLIQLVTAIASKMHLDNANNPALTELQQEVQPGQILEQMEIRQEMANKSDV